jgi:hypothetical protein
VVGDDVFEIFDFCEVYLEVTPIFLDYLIAEVVDHALHEVQHLLGQQIGLTEAAYVGDFGRLEVEPDAVELPLDELAPEEVPEECLVFAQVLLVDDEVEGERALEVQAEVVDGARLLFDERLLRGQLLEFKSLYAMDLLVDG